MGSLSSVEVAVNSGRHLICTVSSLLGKKGAKSTKKKEEEEVECQLHGTCTGSVNVQQHHTLKRTNTHSVLCWCFLFSLHDQAGRAQKENILSMRTTEGWGWGWWWWWWIEMRLAVCSAVRWHFQPVRLPQIIRVISRGRVVAVDTHFCALLFRFTVWMLGYLIEWKCSQAKIIKNSYKCDCETCRHTCPCISHTHSMNVYYYHWIYSRLTDWLSSRRLRIEKSSGALYIYLVVVSCVYCVPVNHWVLWSTDGRSRWPDLRCALSTG